MRHLLILLALVVQCFTASAQSFVLLTEGQPVPDIHAFWFEGDVERSEYIVQGGVVLAPDVVSLRSKGIVLQGGLLYAVQNANAWFDVYGDANVAFGLADLGQSFAYEFPVSIVYANDGLLWTPEELVNYSVTPVPEPSTNVFFLMGLALLVLSNKCQSAPRSPLAGSLQPRLCLSRSATSAGRSMPENESLPHW